MPAPHLVKTEADERVASTNSVAKSQGCAARSAMPEIAATKDAAGEEVLVYLVVRVASYEMEPSNFFPGNRRHDFNKKMIFR